MKQWNEIRLDHRGEIDDVVISCDTVHLEQLSDKQWWLGVYCGDELTMFVLTYKRGEIKCVCTENGLDTKIVEADK